LGGEERAVIRRNMRETRLGDAGQGKKLENPLPQPEKKRGRLTTLCENNEAENPEPQLENKRGRLTTLYVNNEAENGAPSAPEETRKNIKTNMGGFQQ